MKKNPYTQYAFEQISRQQKQYEASVCRLVYKHVHIITYYEVTLFNESFYKDFPVCKHRRFNVKAVYNILVLVFIFPSK